MLSIYKYIIASVVIFVAVSAFGCDSPKEDLSEIKRQEEQVFILEHPNIPFHKRPAYSLTPTLEKVEEQLGTPDYAIKDNELYLEKRILTDGSYLFCAYNSIGHLIETWHASRLFQLDDFLVLQINASTYNDIENIDATSYLFEQGESGYSEHKLHDKQVMQIEYQKSADDWLISDLALGDDDSYLSQFIHLEMETNVDDS